MSYYYFLQVHMNPNHFNKNLKSECDALQTPRNQQWCPRQWRQGWGVAENAKDLGAKGGRVGNGGRKEEAIVPGRSLEAGSSIFAQGE